ncbi:MAG: LytS/YhcK type 5TM receptor domain-containing protein [Clostridium sp.]|nr:LytS/YhcK type 5TM receptor domain-containing protein [Clostridium sp.]
MIFELINRLIGNFGYIILASFIMIKAKIFQKSITNEIHSRREIILVSAMFSILGIMGTCLGVHYKGSIVNIRNASIILASIVYGPLIGGISGTICALHRFLYTGGVITAVPCSIATAIAGIVPGMFYKKCDKKDKYVFGVFSIISVESISIILIRVICGLDQDTIASIYIPMIVINSIGYCMMVSILDNILKEKDRIEGNQAKLTLEIASKTIPYFKDLNDESLATVCETIRESLDAEVVALTDVKHIMAYSSRNNEAKLYSKNILSIYTKRALKSKEPVILNDNNEKLFFYFDKKNVIKSAIITPLIFDREVIGSLKVYFSKSSHITDQHKHMVLGLASIVSTELQLGKIKEYENMANKAEIKALQTQINPHFLFNALNTITSFVRVNPDEARKLIVKLSEYLRYNLEFKEDFIELREEINQVNSFVAIEKARFPGKFEVHYEIGDEDMNIKIPPLTIEPLVENAIKHGILGNMSGKNVYVKCIRAGKSKKIVIEDDGCGIDEKIVNDIYEGKCRNSKVGLYNVYSRIKLIYGTRLRIERLERGTRISFEI